MIGTGSSMGARGGGLSNPVSISLQIGVVVSPDCKINFVSAIAIENSGLFLS